MGSSLKCQELGTQAGPEVPLSLVLWSRRQGTGTEYTNIFAGGIVGRKLGGRGNMTRHCLCSSESKPGKHGSKPKIILPSKGHLKMSF